MPSPSAPPSTKPIGTTVRGDPDLDGNDFPEKPSGWPFKDPFDFIRGKRKDDGIPKHLHRVHDGLYDLSDFRHPGGDQWLSLTRGTDITELFEIHHLDSERVNRMIHLYKVEPEPGDPPLPPRRSPFTFEPNGFYCTLRKKVWDAFGGEVREKKRSRVAALGPSRASKIMADTLAVVSLLLTMVASQATSMTVSALTAVANGIINGTFIGIGHNFMHQKDSFRRHYQDISGFSSAEFRMHHAISHHAYTNTVLDAEINQFLPDISFFPGEKTAKESMFGKIALSVACIIGVPLKQVKRFVDILTGQFHGDAADTAAQLIPLLQLALLASQKGTRTGASLWLMMLGTTSNMFLWANFLTGPHFNDECWHQGDTLDSRDWGMMQVQTNTEREEMSHEDTFKANLINIPTFGLHHLHHLFPTVDAYELSKIVPIFNEHCEEWGVTFSMMSQSEMGKGLWQCLDGYEPNTRTRNGIYSKL
jgi:fatty acid desaturase